jgi:acetolactate synthase-1/2/3 large subunit
MKFGQYLITLLEQHGVDTVFGIPGVHTAELYRALGGSRIRHITPRHEQGAGFMADGYARMTGRPGVCFVITGPGLTNIATAMAQAYAESLPMLVISGVNSVAELGNGNGNLHELPDQRALAVQLAAFSHTLLRANELPAVLARAFACFAATRPRPVHIEIPVDVMEQDVDAADWVQSPWRMAPPTPGAEAISEAARLLRNAQRPAILCGGGVRHVGALVATLAERCDAPVIMTVNGRGLLPLGHELAVPASPSLAAVRRLVAESDVVLALGTEMGRTDYDMYSVGGFAVPGQLIRVDVDPQQIVRFRAPELALVGDSAATLALLLEQMAGDSAPRNGAKRAETARAAALEELSPAMRVMVGFLDKIREALPGVAIVGDSTQAIYAGNLFYEPDAANGWFNSATGYGTLGYALPASIGASLGAPRRPIVCLAGDGGLQFTVGELGSAIDAGTPIIVLVWNNQGYGEIKTYMQDRGITPEGVDLHTPDFLMIARAYGWTAERLEHATDLTQILQAAAQRQGPTLIEFDEAVIMR